MSIDMFSYKLREFQIDNKSESKHVNVINQKNQLRNLMGTFNRMLEKWNNKSKFANSRIMKMVLNL